MDIFFRKDRESKRSTEKQAKRQVRERDRGEERRGRDTEGERKTKRFDKRNKNNFKSVKSTRCTFIFCYRSWKYASIRVKRETERGRDRHRRRETKIQVRESEVKREKGER